MKFSQAFSVTLLMLTVSNVFSTAAPSSTLSPTTPPARSN